MAQFPTDGGLVKVQLFGYIRIIVYGFHVEVNLISFSLAEMFVGHKELRMLGQEALNSKKILNHLIISHLKLDFVLNPTILIFTYF